MNCADLGTHQKTATMLHSISHIRYLALIFLVPVALGIVVYTFNYLVDPLWHFKGNTITGYNYLWNERVSKTNLLLQNPKKYNCLILGSSRSIFLNPNKIEGYTCFNYAFALAGIDHYVEFLSYFTNVSGPPELVIIGVDSSDLLGKSPGHIRKDQHNVPDFIRAKKRPPNAIATYLSYKALDFSFRTVLGTGTLPMYYRPDFTGDILPDSGPFDPRILYEPDLKSGMFPLAGFTLESVERFRQLLDMLPETTRVIAYTPPISAHYMARLALEGTLDAYLRTLYSIGRLFERFYDFTVPSSWTRSTELTYDGGHFYRRVHDRIAAIINGAPVEAALAIHEMSWRQYSDSFRSSVEEFILKRGV